ncbi:hypothetical protein [uncultured Lacinutrix sp.]|uniref:hypothetical protein n=1 Tax=uncultured Lacinutrix sp. TaxID=574032 RepID=UPI002601B5D9|nr:hypothetical protein [uncultured Lacinutrix sp.]
MKTYIILVLACFSLILLMQCSSSKKGVKMEEKKIEFQSDIVVKAPYYTKWAAGEKSGGTGFNVYFPNLINKSNYPVETVYFRNLTGRILVGKGAYFVTLKDKTKDIIMSNEPNAEYGNTLPNNQDTFPFQLKDNECVISYIVNGETKYYKMNNLVEKPGEYLPSQAPRQNKD